MSNIVTIPDFVDYPDFYCVDDNKSLFNDVFCYFIEKYENTGYSLYLGFREDCFLCRMADFKSNDIAHSDMNEESLSILSYVETLKSIMLSAKIPDALFYFAKSDDGYVLVDVMLSANKFIGPGMLRDLFEKIVPTQKVIDIEIVNKESILKHKGNLIKPSRFRYLVEEGSIRPQYGMI